MAWSFSMHSLCFFVVVEVIQWMDNQGRVKSCLASYFVETCELDSSSFSFSLVRIQQTSILWFYIIFFQIAQHKIFQIGTITLLISLILILFLHLILLKLQFLPLNLCIFSLEQLLQKNLHDHLIIVSGFLKFNHVLYAKITVHYQAFSYFQLYFDLQIVLVLFKTGVLYQILSEVLAKGRQLGFDFEFVFKFLHKFYGKFFYPKFGLAIGYIECAIIFIFLFFYEQDVLLLTNRILLIEIIDLLEDVDLGGGGWIVLGWFKLLFHILTKYIPRATYIRVAKKQKYRKILIQRHYRSKSIDFLYFR